MIAVAMAFAALIIGSILTVVAALILMPKKPREKPSFVMPSDEEFREVAEAILHTLRLREQARYVRSEISKALGPYAEPGVTLAPDVVVKDRQADGVAAALRRAAANAPCDVERRAFMYAPGVTDLGLPRSPRQRLLRWVDLGSGSLALFINNLFPESLPMLSRWRSE